MCFRQCRASSALLVGTPCEFCISLPRGAQLRMPCLFFFCWAMFMRRHTHPFVVAQFLHLLINYNYSSCVTLPSLVFFWTLSLLCDSSIDSGLHERLFSYVYVVWAFAHSRDELLWAALKGKAELNGGIVVFEPLDCVGARAVLEGSSSNDLAM